MLFLQVSKILVTSYLKFTGKKVVQFIKIDILRFIEGLKTSSIKLLNIKKHIVIYLFRYKISKLD